MVSMTIVTVRLTMLPEVAMLKDILNLPVHAEYPFATMTLSAVLLHGMHFVVLRQQLMQIVLSVYVVATTMTWMDSRTAMATVMISMRM